jgi:hypothetical protein
MKIDIAGPMSLNLLDFDFKGVKVPKGYTFPLVSNIINALRVIGHEIVAHTTSWYLKETLVFKNESFTICVCPRRGNAGRTLFKSERGFLEEAVHHHRRLIIIGIDNRAKEMSKDIKLNVIERGSIEELKDKIINPFDNILELPMDKIEQWKDQFKQQ